ncbi:major facilitator superfamily protein [Actinidia rufa]|uniref:Major facilitator superfamily protein n=1 Tax=Actinidia rufa TaxID=165716 RepID=A0A7J0H463_9ERIC|nr:major facilitator superfamily protein [Actinidia rufa]
MYVATSKRSQNPNQSLPNMVHWHIPKHPTSHPKQLSHPPSTHHGSPPRTPLQNPTRVHASLHIGLRIGLRTPHNHPARPVLLPHVAKDHWSISTAPSANRDWPHVVLLSMAMSAVVESRRLKIAQDISSSTVPMSVLWLVPQLALAGIGEAFHFSGNTNLFYQEFPAALKSTVTAMVAMFIGIAYYLGTALVIRDNSVCSLNDREGEKENGKIKLPIGQRTPLEFNNGFLTSNGILDDTIGFQEDEVSDAIYDCSHEEDIGSHLLPFPYM